MRLFLRSALSGTSTDIRFAALGMRLSSLLDLFLCCGRSQLVAKKQTLSYICTRCLDQESTPSLDTVRVGPARSNTVAVGPCHIMTMWHYVSSTVGLKTDFKVYQLSHLSHKFCPPTATWIVTISPTWQNNPPGDKFPKIMLIVYFLLFSYFFLTVSFYKNNGKFSCTLNDSKIAKCTESYSDEVGHTQQTLRTHGSLAFALTWPNPRYGQSHPTDTTSCPGLT